MAFAPKHQTPQEFFKRFREAFREGKRERLAKLAIWLLNRITAGDVTDTQVRNEFNLTINQWNTLKTKMQTLVDNYNSVQSAAGE